MKTIYEVATSIQSLHINDFSTGFDELDSYIYNANNIVYYIVKPELIDHVVKHLKIPQENDFYKLGDKTSYFILKDNVSEEELEILSKRTQNNKTSAILIKVSDSPKCIESIDIKLLLNCSFVAEITNENLEMIIHKNRYGKNGKVQLNLKKQSIIELLKYKTNKYNIILGAASGFKTVSMHSIIKDKLQLGEKICYCASFSDINNLLLSIKKKKRSELLETKDLKELHEKYGEQLFFQTDLTNIPEDVIVFSDLDFSLDQLSYLTYLNNKEIWATLSRNRLGVIDFEEIKSQLGDSAETGYLNIVAGDDNKIIIETFISGTAFLFDSRIGQINDNLFVNLSNYETIIGLDFEIQKMTSKINNENCSNIQLMDLTKQRDLLISKFGEKVKKNKNYRIIKDKNE